ncbi:MAG: Tim44/TimA family putative adaptor protein [Siculibacillus sp.]|nr:Tim44/TimA family putative adaptor protein [Siculibacillus sp.]
MSLDFFTIVFFAIAVMVFVRLYGVLGTKNGSEQPPFRPLDPPEARDDGSAGNDNVIQLPRNPEPIGRDPVRPQGEPQITLPPDTPPESSLAAALRAIMTAERGFDVGRFLDGSKVAYEMIVTAYAAGDRRTLKNLLSKEVLDSFITGIDDREKRGEKVEFTFVGIDKADLVEASVKAGRAEITVRFAAKVIQVTRKADGTVVEGDPARLTDLVDVWTFARDLGTSDPNWRLVDTRAVD